MPIDAPPPPDFHDPRMRGFRSRATVAEAQALIDSRVAALGLESIPLDEADGRVLASEIVSSVDLPPFDRAAMDGYALRGESTFGSGGFAPACFRLVGQSRPGRPFAGVVAGGDAVEIATGAPMPAGADAVAPVETTRRAGPAVLVLEPVPPGRHVGRKGEDVAIGAAVFAPGRRLRPQDVGVLSGLGLAAVEAIRRPVVSVLITGEELLPPGTAPRDARIADMNGPMLAALIARDGGLARVRGPLPDDRDALRVAVLEAAGSSDAVLISGGSSTGPEDFAPSLVAELGELPIHGIAIRPASPAGLGFVAGVPIALMPGNPVSCLCAHDFFAGRIVRRLGGRNPEWPYRAVELPLGEKLTSALGRVDYVRATIRDGRVYLLATGGASMLSGASRADGFVVVPADSEGLPEGATARVYLYGERR